MAGQVISYGESVTDDLAVDPAALQYLGQESSYILLDEGDDADPTENEQGWPLVRGDRIVWASDETDSEPIAVVTPGRARDGSLLLEVARSVAADAGAVVEIVRFGEVTADDLRLSPAAEARLGAETEFTMLDVGEDDPPDAGAAWPIARGDRVAWAVDEGGEEAEPIALVRADRALDYAVLEAVGMQWVKDADEITVVVAEVPGARTTAPAEAPSAAEPARPAGAVTTWSDLRLPDISTPATATGSQMVVDPSGRVLDYSTLLTLYRQQARRIEELEAELRRLRDAGRDPAG
jgi:PAS domain-containing protein